MFNVTPKYFLYQIGPNHMKVCRPLKKTRKKFPVFLKFVYFNDENETHERRKQLARQLNNGTQMYVTLRLPRADVEIREKRNQLQLGLVVVLKKCAVCISQKTRRWTFQSVKDTKRSCWGHNCCCDREEKESNCSWWPKFRVQWKKPTQKTYAVITPTGEKKE